MKTIETHPKQTTRTENKKSAGLPLAGGAHSPVPETDRATLYAFYFMTGAMGLAVLYFLSLPFVL